ncbi:hypothetical protein AM499_19815 [Bacillus sp. FJAT-22090]|nr:hypothetical protein AM499_19815 [Bacillus sp. FJAT-22090]KQL35318.1 hypothetical protein AN959_10320 [Psychrobacillus sp. FJAT-21963]
MLLVPIIITIFFIIVQADISKRGFIKSSFIIALLYSFIIIAFFQTSNILVMMLLVCISLWLMFFGALAMG